MRYFVVRHKITQRLLPQTRLTGSSWWEPETDEVIKNELPRLFYSSRAAANFIIMWAKGHAVKKREGGVYASGPDFVDDYEYNEWLVWEPVPGRSRDQLEIVPVHLKFGEPIS